MKLNKKGFTLVELLAVIVILAVIAVIAVPSILGIIEGARKDSFRADVRSAFKAAELEYVRTAMDGNGGQTIFDLSPTATSNKLVLENHNFVSGILTAKTTSNGDIVVEISQDLVGKKYKTSGVSYMTQIDDDAAVVQ